MVKLSKSSAMHWYPKIKDLENINIPKTVVVEIRPEDITVLCGMLDTFIMDYGDKFDKALQSFTFPVFVKTDELAGKHDWKDTCYIKYKEDFYLHLQQLAKLHVKSNTPLQAFLIREFLVLKHQFEFFMGNMPIAKERRYFVKDGKVACHHPYWDESVFLDEFEKEDMALDRDIAINYTEDQRNKIMEGLRVINTENAEEIAMLTKIATKVAEVMEGAWSIDFACDVNGKWWLIDMALAKESWHPEGCEYYSELSRKELDICPKCNGNMDMEIIIDDSREEWVCQYCGMVKRTVKWLSKSEYEIEKEEVEYGN